MRRASNYDSQPYTPVEETSTSCYCGWPSIVSELTRALSARVKSRTLLVIECYPGVNLNELGSAFRQLKYDAWINSESAFKEESEIREMVHPDVTDDRLFGYMTRLSIDDYFDERRLSTVRAAIDSITSGLVVVFGTGAAALCQVSDMLVYADMERWEIQLRMRALTTGNLGLQNTGDAFSDKYKRGYFVDWRIADRHKKNLMERWDFFLDTQSAEQPVMVTGAAMRKGISLVATRPFRVVPFFDPGPWGGQWLKETFDLDRSAVNYAWGFDCVPEENSLILGFGDVRLRMPSVNLVYAKPKELLGEEVYARFGDEFPIRFDFLDTMDGGNLSLQVHPLTAYIREKFGMDYTQDESYYFLDAKADASVYLGVRDDVNAESMIEALQVAESSGTFNVTKFVASWPVKKHDHVSIPAGTVHCSGANTVVLEISATPYIFTFKLWDWARPGLDGLPRPINVEHGRNVIQWERNASWVKENLLNQTETIAIGNGYREERTGLHKLEFIETRRHWFTRKVLHDTHGTVNVLNLVAGRQAVVESPTGAFPPFVVSYAETFIVPAAVGAYSISPYGESDGEEIATIKAYVRPSE